MINEWAKRFITIIKEFFYLNKKDIKIGIGHNEPPEPIEEFEIEEPVVEEHPEFAAAVQTDIAEDKIILGDTRKEKDGKNFGTLYYMDDLLEKLDDCFRCLRRLRNHDKEAYDLYQKIGCQFTTEKNLLQVHKLCPAWKTERPALAAVHCEVKSKETLGGMNYIRKVKQPWDVEKFQGDIYEVIQFIDDWQKQKGLGIASFHIGLDKDCNIKLLRQRVKKTKTIWHYSRDSKGRDRRSPSVLHYQEWDYPEFLKETAKEHKCSIEKQATVLFVYVANFAFNANDGFKVICSDGGINAVFNIDMLRTPYFFDSREKVKNDKGSTKKIFHLVRVHKRVTEKGEKFIKTHFRGVRKFKWNGYDVSIVHPKLGLDINTFNLGSDVFPDDEPIQKGYIDNAKLGKMLEERISV